MKTHIKLTVILTITLIASTQTQAGIGFIGLDGIRNNTYESLTSGEDYQTMREILTAQGQTLVPFTDSPISNLEGIDCLFLRQANYSSNQYSQQEITTIHNFVAAGGSLVFFAEGGYSTDGSVANANQLLAPYGVTIYHDAIDGGGRVITGFLPHPITRNINAIGLDYQRPLITINAPAIDLTTGPDLNNILAVIDGVNGAGNVVILSDSAMFNHREISDTNIYEHDNLQLLYNITDHLIIPEPATLAISSTCFALALLHRRH